MLESEVGEGGFLVNIVVGVNDQAFCFGHVGWFVAAGRVYFADEGFAGSGSLVKCDVPDAALPFVPAYGGDILLNIVVGVPRFGDDGARNRVVVEADGCVGACLWVVCEPVAGCFGVEPAWVAPGFVDGAHDAVFDVWCDGGRVGGVTGGGAVVDVGISDATEPCVVESVGSSSKVSLLDCWADVTYECGESNVSAARAREFVVKRLSDDATGIGGECLARANGDNPFERSNVRLRVRDAEGRVVDVPDVDGVLSALAEVDDDERELMWESMMGSTDSK